MNGFEISQLFLSETWLFISIKLIDSFICSIFVLSYFIFRENQWCEISQFFLHETELFISMELQDSFI